jgi:hypothetical protein
MGKVIMATSTKAVPVTKTFSTSIRSLAVATIVSDGKAEKTKNAFFGALFADGILPSELKLYSDDIKTIVLSTFPKKVQEAVVSKLVRKDDLIKGVKAERTGNLMKKIEWQWQINTKCSRLLEGYSAYLARHQDKVEVDGTLQPIAVDAMGRAVRLPKAEKPIAVRTVEQVFILQAAWSNVKSPTTLEIEMAKDFMRILDRAKSMTTEARQRFNELSAPKPSGAKQVTAKAKAKK